MFGAVIERKKKGKIHHTLIYSPQRGNCPHYGVVFGGRAVTAPWDSVASSVAVNSNRTLGNIIVSGGEDPMCWSTEKTKRHGHLVKRTRLPSGSG